jgi:Putative prokaryotic signal transducing protein
MDLVTVVRTANQVEADFVQNLLQAEGIPSIVQAVVPDPSSIFGSLGIAGPRDVLVPRSALEAARAVLDQRGS